MYFFYFYCNFCIKPYEQRTKTNKSNRRLCEHIAYISDTALTQTHNLFRHKLLIDNKKVSFSSKETTICRQPDKIICHLKDIELLCGKFL